MTKRMLAGLVTMAGLAAFASLSGLPVKGWQYTNWYGWSTAFLLAVGLYSSTYGIDLEDAARDKWLILRAVTIGVLLKSFIIGGVMYLTFDRDPFMWVVSIAVAQIDPIAVAALEGNSRLSARAKTILRAWSSLDDPVTTLLVVYVPEILRWVTGDEVVPHLVDVTTLADYSRDVGLNVVFVCVMYAGWRMIHLRRQWWRWPGYGVMATAFVGAFLVVGSVSFWMLGIALAGLAVRPPIGRVVDRAPKFALAGAIFLLMVLLAQGVDPVRGIVLGVAAYGSQVVAAHVLASALPLGDRWRLALAQQNGITAITLSLVLEAVHAGSVAIIGPAIVTVAGLYFGVNALANRWLDARDT